uniref:Uncharacterized protein n=1 Tax=Lactuca sativa TaxID=4236 RepID=A0A9R1VSI6_LACSA|nr:hypothetical protein LSAT_V11C400170630 [Lactuca sativa]
MGFHFRTASCCSLFASKLTESGNLVYNAREGAKRPKDEPQLALSKGDEDLAREALKRRKSYAENAASLRTQLDQQKGVMDNLVNNTRILESKIQEAKSKKDTLKARAQSAKTATKVSEMLGNVNTSSALSAFEKMEEKVMTMESQAEALNQLTTDDLEGRWSLYRKCEIPLLWSIKIRWLKRWVPPALPIAKRPKNEETGATFAAGRSRVLLSFFYYRVIALLFLFKFKKKIKKKLYWLQNTVKFSDLLCFQLILHLL